MAFFAVSKKCTFIQLKATMMIKRKKMFPTLVSVRFSRWFEEVSFTVSNKANQEIHILSEYRTQ